MYVYASYLFQTAQNKDESACNILHQWSSEASVWDNEPQSWSVFSSLKNMLTKTKQKKTVHDLFAPFYIHWIPT